METEMHDMNRAKPKEQKDFTRRTTSLFPVGREESVLLQWSGLTKCPEQNVVHLLMTGHIFLS